MKTPPVKKIQDVMQDTIDRQMDFLRAYKIRQDATVLGLGEVRRALEDGYYPTAKDKLDEVLATTLKQSKDRVDNLLLALKIAVDQLGKIEDHPAERKECQDVLSQIEIIAPAEFRAVSVAENVS